MKLRGGTSFLLLLIATTSCSDVTTVPPSHYRDPDYGLAYRVHTTDGKTYYVADFTATDSTLTILHFRKPNKETPASTLPTPFQVSLSNVSSVESIKPGGATPLILAGAFVFVMALSIGFGGWSYD
ncbi:MAG TPA: hypothetical protein VFH33_01250 [Candidatus Krumholzibacteria bacterium]|nr:hypothetical protein [Candidatus Krumholzibacteria bacterium]